MLDGRVKVLQNDSSKEKATIRITSLDPEWDTAYAAWQAQKNPTSAPEWKTGVVFLLEGAPAKDIWQTDYWHEGHHIYDFFMKQYDCSKCKQKRTGSGCSSCRNAAKESTNVIDVLAPTVIDEISAEKDSSFRAETYLAMQDAYLYVNALFARLDKVFNLARSTLKNHGGQLHEPGIACTDCLIEMKAWLETNHQDWRIKTKEAGCCSLCVQRAYKMLTAPETTVSKVPVTKEKTKVVEAVTL